MKKLIRGIVDFRKNVRPTCKETFAQLALGQRPDTLFICCSDSRVVPNLFASTDPGDLFVVRNVGNLVPLCCQQTHTDDSMGAALEFSLTSLPVTEIIVCGHSECGAMQSLEKKLGEKYEHSITEKENSSIQNWLQHGNKCLELLSDPIFAQIGEHLEVHNQLSQINVLIQMEHLKSYPLVKERIEQGRLKLHGWWFDLIEANVYEFDHNTKQFELIDEDYAQVLLTRASEASLASSQLQQ